MLDNLDAGVDPPAIEGREAALAGVVDELFFIAAGQCSSTYQWLWRWVGAQCPLSLVRTDSCAFCT